MCPNCKEELTAPQEKLTITPVLAKQLAVDLNAQYINLTGYAKIHDLTFEKDLERKTIIIDEEKMRVKLGEP